MIDWTYFPYSAALSLSAWFVALVLAYTKNNKPAYRRASYGLVLFGLCVHAVFVALLWHSLQRPPLRTLGETRLWYSVFLPAIGLLLAFRWRYRWLLAYSLLMAALFMGINLWQPDTYNKSLMPALQSPWFVPHVVVYLLAYALLGMSALVALRGLWAKPENAQTHYLPLADNLVYLGLGFLTLGLLFGAFWAKEAWGHYWAWDPKENWALITWLAYLFYVHLRTRIASQSRMGLWVLVAAFVLLLVAWMGIQYLPVGQHSVHTYSQQA